MKKLVAFAVVVAAVSFASCGNKNAENAETADVAVTETVVEGTTPAGDVVAEEDVVVEADSTAAPAAETNAAPAE